MRRFRIFLSLSAVVLALGTGCSGRKPVSVIVTLDGKAVEGATVTLIPETGGAAGAAGFTGSDGTATLDTPKKEGVLPGTYKVLVTKTKASSSGPVGLPKEGDAKMSKEEMNQRQEQMMGAGKGEKSELPEGYDNLTKTSLKLTIPLTSSPAPIELKSKK